MRAMIALPLTHEGVTFGGMVLFSSVSGGFDSETVPLLEELAGNLAFGLASRDLAPCHGREPLGQEGDWAQHQALVGMFRLSMGWEPLEEKLNRSLTLLAELRWGTAIFSGAVLLAETRNPAGFTLLGSYNLPSLPVCPCTPATRNYWCLCEMALQEDRLVELSPDIPDQANGPKAQISIPLSGNASSEAGVLSLFFSKPTLLSEDRKRFLVTVGALMGELIERNRIAEGARQNRRHRSDTRRVMHLSQVGASLAHQPRQPLTAAINYGNLAMETMGSQADSHGGADFLRKNLAQVQRIHRIVTDMRNFLRQGKLQKEETDRNALLREALELLEAETSWAQTSRIRLDLTPDLPKVPCDAIQIQEVILNLVRNAFEALEENGSEEKTETAITITTSGNKEVGVTIEDQGPGLPDHHLESIYQPFFSTKQQGVGRGLPICHSIIEAHGGRFWGEPCTAGSGARFRFTLPRTGGLLRDAE
ncbi:ATP-binding protein [Thiohalorhabdus sp. Cl-TMA]|uniref:histidine kinase n=1 Tax=Thiohalorhabdus methylotrophus TaxID=3242694 RepID=A0ABV4TVU9_9GAMM